MLFLVLPKQWREGLVRHPPIAFLVKTLILFLLVFLGFAMLFQFAEKKGWEIAIWMSWETLATVGYGDFPAVTTLGRTFTIISGTIGIIIMSAVIGAAVVVFQYREQRRRTGYMNNPHKNGYVIFNFPGVQSTMAFIHEIRAVEPGVGICIVDVKLPELPSIITDLPNVHFLSGSVIDRETYERANLLNNKVAIVFPSDPGNPDSDGQTRTIVDLLGDFNHNGLRIMHILVDSRNKWMFERLPSAQVLETLEILALVQECQDPHSSGIIEQLLKNSEGANPETVEVSGSVGMTWSELQIRCAQTAKNLRLQMNLFALVRSGKIQTCPQGDEIICKGDFLSIIVFPGFDWGEFERKAVG